MIQAPDLALAISCLVAAFAGSTMNGFVIFLMLSKQHIRQQHYICFILNKTIIDFILCLQLIIESVAIFTSTPATSPLCLAAGMTVIGLGFASDYADTALACNRYFAVVHNDLYKRLYTKRNIYLMCVVVWLIGCVLALNFTFARQLGHTFGYFCTLVVTSPVSAATFDGCGMLALVAVVCFNYGIRRRLLEHQNQMNQMTSAQRSQLQLDQDLVRFITVNAFVPMLTQVPIIVCVSLQRYTAVSDWAFVTGYTLWMSWSVANPIVTLLMVKPLRTEGIAVWRRLRGKNVVTPLSQGQAAAVAGNVSLRRY